MVIDCNENNVIKIYSEVSDIPVLKIISVLVSIKFELNHFSISFYTVSEFFSVLVSIKFFLEIISVQFQVFHCITTLTSLPDNVAVFPAASPNYAFTVQLFGCS